MDTHSHSPSSLPSFSEPLLSTGSPSVHPLSLLSDPPSSTSRIRKVAWKNRNAVLERAQDKSYRPATTIAKLPDNVLLEIFDFYRMDHEDDKRRAWKWRFLVHVCQRWRQVVFASPQRLDLRILCTRRTPVRKNLRIWPTLPIVLYLSGRSIRPNAEHDAITVLEHPDQICDVTLLVPGPRLEKLAKIMQVPFPLLTHLVISPGAGDAPTLPSNFLGGSAPALRKITLTGVSYPSLPTLLLSAGDLVELRLLNIPPTGYISPETMTVGLAALPRLKFFRMEFQSAASRPDRIRPPPATQAVLPVLNKFEFKGASEYLEDLVAQITSPQLDWIHVYYLNQLADFRASELSRFICRSEGPGKRWPRPMFLTKTASAQLTFSSRKVSFTMHLYKKFIKEHTGLEVIIGCKGIDWQAAHVTQLLSQFSVTGRLNHVDHLRITNLKGEFEGIGDVEWWDLLHPFSTVEKLDVSSKLAEHICLALGDVTRGIVLPSLTFFQLPGVRSASINKSFASRHLASTR